MEWITYMTRNGKKIILGAKTIEELETKFKNAQSVGYVGNGKYKFSGEES
jgi:hypothetical protein